jgi:hypothetical protein
MDSGPTHFDGSATGMLCRLVGVVLVAGTMSFTVNPVPSEFKREHVDQ